MNYMVSHEPMLSTTVLLCSAGPLLSCLGLSQVRFRTLVRNQAVLLALAMSRALPYVCSIPGMREPFGACIGAGILLLAIIGVLLPLTILWAFEVYARRAFLASPATEALARTST